MLFLLQNGFRVIAHDRRGHGRSGQASAGNDMNGYADDLATSRGVTHQGHVAQVQGLDDGGEVVRIPIHVVARGGLARTAVATPVMRDHSKPVLKQEQHLAVPRVGIQRPAMGEGDDRTSTPIFVVDRRPVFAGESVHSASSSCRTGVRRQRLAQRPGGEDSVPASRLGRVQRC